MNRNEGSISVFGVVADLSDEKVAGLDLGLSLVVRRVEVLLKADSIALAAAIILSATNSLSNLVTTLGVWLLLWTRWPRLLLTLTLVLGLHLFLSMLLLPLTLSEDSIRNIFLSLRVEIIKLFRSVTSLFPALFFNLSLSRWLNRIISSIILTFLIIFRQYIPKDQFLLHFIVSLLGFGQLAPVFPWVSLHVFTVFEGFLDVRKDLKTVRIGRKAGAIVAPELHELDVIERVDAAVLRFLLFAATAVNVHEVVSALVLGLAFFTKLGLLFLQIGISIHLSVVPVTRRLIEILLRVTCTRPQTGHGLL